MTATAVGTAASEQDHTGAFERATADVERPVYAYRAGPERMGFTNTPESSSGVLPGGPDCLGWVPALPPQRLGAASFLTMHGVRYPYIAGAMAGGIAGERLVITMAQAGMLAFFGTGGLDRNRIERGIKTVQGALSEQTNYGFNLVHNPFNPAVEFELVELFLRHGVRRVSASAFTQLTPALVWFRINGIQRSADGTVTCPSQVFAKVSRSEIARKFMEPPPERLLRQLVESGRIAQHQAELAEGVPMAEDVTAEADSAGHTDNRPAIPLLSSMIDLRDEIVRTRRYPRAIRVGAAGGIGTPQAVAAAFAAGADYILTGSVNQACTEADLADSTKRLLCELDGAAVEMAPAADMFELGARVQVARHGTLFAARANKLYELYRRFGAYEELPQADRQRLERQYFRMPVEEVWQQIETYFQARDPGELERALSSPKHRMALLFRWYLGMSSRWAHEGVEDRRADYQIWCGPALGAFNQWVKGTFFEPPGERRVVQVATNLLYGAAILLRRRLLAMQGVPLPPGVMRVVPRRYPLE